MPPNRHAVLSASSSHRWLHCNPSARLELEFEDRETEAAAEGTAAHAPQSAEDALHPPGQQVRLRRNGDVHGRLPGIRSGSYRGSTAGLPGPQGAH